MSRVARWLSMSLIAALGASVASTPALARGCDELARLALPDTVIEAATAVPAGSYVGPDSQKRADLPAFCRVTAVVKAAPDSEIRVEVWLPEEHWSGVFHGTGNGGYAGSMAVGYGAMEAGLRRGYVVATTDMGTAPATPLNGDPLIGHPSKWKDWGLLATHVMTVTGKAISKAYYGEDVRRSYFTGCSTGGQQGLIEAQYYPEDYEGILIGAPVINRTWGHAAVLWDFAAANRHPGHKLSDAKLAQLTRAAIAACSRTSNNLPGDPFISDPLNCKPDLAALTCRGADSGQCLTAGEVQTARAFYSGPLSRSGHPTYYGWLPGSEIPGTFGWAFLQSPPHDEPAFGGLFKWVFGAGWDWRQFDFDRDMPRVDSRLGAALNGATRADMSRFRARGGRLIVFQGWADTLIAPRQTIDFFNRINSDSTAQPFARLYMVPGVMHCGGGLGPTAFDAANGDAPTPLSNSPQTDLFAALAHWVEDGVAPEQVTATRYIDDTPAKGIAMQRPLCPYPQKAWYKGTGDTHAATSFTCSVEAPATTR